MECSVEWFEGSVLGVPRRILPFWLVVLEGGQNIGPLP